MFVNVLCSNIHHLITHSLYLPIGKYRPAQGLFGTIGGVPHDICGGTSYP